MKKISSRENKPSPFLRLMKKGHGKTGYKAKNGKFLMTMSDDSHKRIASLIRKWLEQDEKRTQNKSHRKSPKTKTLTKNYN